MVAPARLLGASVLTTEAVGIRNSLGDMEEERGPDRPKRRGARNAA